MNLLTVLVLLAALATIASLTSGIVSMARDGEIAHQSSAEWMVWRVLFQAVALILIVTPHSVWH